MSAKLAMSDAGIASDATSDDPQVADEDQDRRGWRAGCRATRCSSSDAIDAWMNCESSRVTVTFTSGGSRGAGSSSFALTASMTCDGVLARLAPHVHDQRALAVEERGRARFLGRVLDRGDVAQPDRRAARRWRRRCSRTARSTRAGRACAASARRRPARCSRPESRRSRRRSRRARAPTVSPCALSFSMSRTTWISRAWPPEMVTSPTPSTVSIARRICLSAISVSARSGSGPDEREA